MGFPSPYIHLYISDIFNVYIDFRLAVRTNDAYIFYISSDLCQGWAEMCLIATVVEQMRALNEWSIDWSNDVLMGV